MTVKRVAPCWCLDGHVTEPYEMSMAWELDLRSNFFSPPAHLSGKGQNSTLKCNPNPGSQFNVES